ncbi:MULTISPECIES: ParB family protein [Pasteurellaceae]|jgi:integrating conjugative element, PFGI_1 class, parB family protein|nr:MULTISPECIES: ParB family protein [Pasteurellaceae]NNI00489.1 chromosome partitioning protein ParB [Pasteurella multocida]RDE67406.1 chromosome partitioning protein ParB [Aggregatibacter segnis]
MNTQKSFFKTKTAEERQQLIRQNMMANTIANTSPDYKKSVQEIQQSANEQQPQLISVTLMQLRPFDGNPRKTKNPKFEEIKESIRMRGLDFAPNITKRPGDDFYIIADGGNTRLQALNELWEETQDPKYWSIRCLYKPWDGDENQGTLSCLIGHLTENDLRGDLSFVERALAIAEIKAMYEKTDDQKLSHRQLSEKLKSDGYSVSYSLLARMEQCLTYLYPYIPNVLLAGMGKPQIEKLLALHNNALSVWQKQLFDDSTFLSIWEKVLRDVDAEPQSFHLAHVQDELIGAMVTKLDNGTTYEDIRFEVDIDEQKRRREDKAFQTSFQNNNGEPVHNFIPSLSESDNNTVNNEDKKTQPQKNKTSEPKLPKTPVQPDNSNDQNNTNNGKQQVSDPNNTQENNSHQSIFDQFGMTPGMSLREQQLKRAEDNGLTFAYTGLQPVNDIWQIFPAFDSFNRLTAEANGLAYDIFQAVGLNPKTLIQYLNAENDISDFTFTLAPLPAGAKDNPLSESIYELMTMLASDKHTDMLSWTIPEELLVGNEHMDATISDVLLVKIFRLIRIVRRMREHLR